MIARLIISKDSKLILDEIKKVLSKNSINTLTHPDVLYYPIDSKLGIEEARKITDYFSLKPYQAKGRVVILENASALTPEAQNSLLKTLEELPKEGLFLLGATSDAKFLPTILSRCQIIKIQGGEEIKNEKQTEIELLLNATLEERFEYVEKLKEKEEFLKALTAYFHKKLPANKEFVKELLKAEKYANQNVNIRAILEYLMLDLPKTPVDHRI